MWENIAQLNKEGIKGQLKKLVRGGIEKTFNELLAAEAEKRTQGAGMSAMSGVRATATATAIAI